MKGLLVRKFGQISQAVTLAPSVAAQLELNDASRMVQ